MLAGGFTDEAGRESYMTAFHAALAFIVSRTGREPKTHKGTHIEFARLAQTEPGIEHALTAFLSGAYELKTVADYEFGAALTPAEAQSSLDQATQFLAVIAPLIGMPEATQPG